MAKHLNWRPCIQHGFKLGWARFCYSWTTDLISNKILLLTLPECYNFKIASTNFTTTVSVLYSWSEQIWANTLFTLILLILVKWHHYNVVISFFCSELHIIVFLKSHAFGWEATTERQLWNLWLLKSHVLPCFREELVTWPSWKGFVKLLSYLVVIFTSFFFKPLSLMTFTLNDFR